MNQRGRRKAPGRRRSARGLFLIILGCALLVGYYYWFMPNRDHVVPDWRKLDKPIFLRDEAMKYSAVGTGKKLMLPLSVVQSRIDPNVRFEKDSKSIIFATPDKLVRLKLGQQEGEMNLQSFSLNAAPVEKNGVVYIPAAELEDWYGIKVQEDSASGAVHLYKPGENIQSANVVKQEKDKTLALRQDASNRSPIMFDLPSGSHLRLLGMKDDWYYAQTDSGYSGYIPKKKVITGEKTRIPAREIVQTKAQKEWKSKRINLTWEAVYQVPANPDHIDDLSGVNVVSPTWFQLADTKGNVKSKADKAYVNRAHANGIQVWGLFSNSFEPDLTHEALSSFTQRLRAIQQMLEYADVYDLDGINIDFENVRTADGENVTQFIRELRPLAHAKGLTISLDVTPKSESELWSKFLDRRNLSSIVDFMVLMAYDEHWASSPKAGSVASLPWTEAAVHRLIDEDEVPTEKLILAVPLYTRVWTEKTVNGKTKVTSKAIGMDKAQAILNEKKLKPTFDSATRQNYVEYQEDGARKRIWLEDEASLRQRVDVVNKLNLAGIASWHRGFASEYAWSILDNVN